MKFILVVILFLLPLAARADEPRRKYLFASANKKFELKRVSGRYPRETWALVEKAGGGVRYEIAAGLSPMTVFVSDDGSSVAAVDDYSEEDFHEKLRVLFFYRGGKLIKSYTLGDLLGDSQNVTRSVSHFSWTTFKRMAFGDSKLTLQTLELNTYTFDTTTGEVSKKERDPLLTDDAIYVYGEVKKLGGDRYSIRVCRRIYGAVPDEGIIEFTAAPEKGLHEFYHSVIIRNGVLSAALGHGFNSCNHR